MSKSNRNPKRRQARAQRRAARLQRKQLGYGQHSQRSAGHFHGFDGPMTYEGRIITPEIIAKMREDKPEHAYQLDEKWERQVLEHNAPWLKDPDERERFENLWDKLSSKFPRIDI